jgi:D-3-phosphoglycerate dehydrogenase
MSIKVLVATEKPFAPAAVEGIKEICAKAEFECILLEKYADKAELLAAVKDVDALIVRSDKVTEEVIAHADNLKIVVRGGAGYDNVDLAAASAKNICVMNTPGQNSNAVAELAFGMMLFAARNNFMPKAGTELREKTIGIHAYGNVGRYVANIAKGFGMTVKAFDPFVCNCKIEEDGVVPVETVEELYSTCDYISLHIPSNEHTKASINTDLFNIMKDNAVLVNTARKEVICEESLKKVLTEKPGFKYLTDIAPVCDAELKEAFAGQYFATPKKMGAQTKEANINAGKAAANQIVAFLKDGDNTFQVNK